ncbi:MAG: sodium:solute symporter family protein [Saprospiraceae bacterium]
MLLTFIIVYLLITIGIGWWASTRVHSTKDFVVAGRQLPLMLAACASFATWFGSETLMGASAEFVEGGLISVVEDPFGAALCLILVGAFYARKLYRLNILTFCDFFKLRFSRAVEFWSAFLIVPSYFGWIAAQLVAMAIILQTLTNIPFIYGIMICTVAVIIYTYIGGMWAVSITDFVQTIMIVIGLLALLWQINIQAGGVEKVLASTPPGFFQFTPKPDFTSMVQYFAAWITIGLGSIPQQDVFQRVMAAKDENTSVRAAWLAGIMYLTIGFIPLYIGLCAKNLYPELLSGDPQMLLPQMVLQHTSTLMQILFFGALMSAILSTTSGAVLAPATIIGENLIRPYIKRISDQRLLQIMRFAVVGVAVASALMTGWKTNIYELVGMSSAFSLVSLFVPLTAGLYWKKASNLGALLSISTGMVVWIVFEWIPTDIPSLVWGLLASILGMLVGSFWKPDNTHQSLYAILEKRGKA